jgi:uncharacterized protein
MPTLTCPICRKHFRYTSRDEVPWRPFCSRHCKLVDLGRWLNEEYRISEGRDEFEEGPIPDESGPAEDD